LNRRNPGEVQVSGLVVGKKVGKNSAAEKHKSRAYLGSQAFFLPFPLPPKRTVSLSTFALLSITSFIQRVPGRPNHFAPPYTISITFFYPIAIPMPSIKMFVMALGLVTSPVSVFPKYVTYNNPGPGLLQSDQCNGKVVSALSPPYRSRLATATRPPAVITNDMGTLARPSPHKQTRQIIRRRQRGLFKYPDIPVVNRQLCVVLS
jgi:hypothetical protein